MNYTTECSDPACQSIDLVLTWDDANGMFDLQHYVVNISGNITIVTNASHTVCIMPETDYLVLVSTVTKCHQASSATEIIVRAGKLYMLGKYLQVKRVSV